MRGKGHSGFLHISGFLRSGFLRSGFLRSGFLHSRFLRSGFLHSGNVTFGIITFGKSLGHCLSLVSQSCKRGSGKKGDRISIMNFRELISDCNG